MKEEIINLKNQALAQITEIDNLEDLKDLQITYLGRNGRLSKLIKKIKEVKGGDKKEIGIQINQTKKTLLELIASQKQKIKSKSNTEFDETVPGILPPVGNLHLVTKAIEEIAKTFKAIGFSQARYNEVEWDYFGFESLNFTKDHPARDDWETFFVDVPEDKKLGPMILTPHTSSGQVREMKRVGTPPIRMVNIAKCYRRQADVSHVPMFHQFEGLVVDKNISIVNLKGTLDYFAQNFFGESRKTRLRPYHFPFTEPSFEVDISCDVCEGSGCKLCKGGWLELGGAGMVHPNVLRNGGIDPKIYSGFAFGWGVERTYMMKEGLKIPDIRLLYSSNLQILKQF